MASLPFIDLKAQYKRLKPKIDAAIQEVLDDGRYVLGPAVTRLEEELAEFAGVKHVITASSGTDALFMPLLALEVGPGDAVFVPSFTFTATAEVILLAGAAPVFVDVDADTFNIDTAHLETMIEKVKAEGRLNPKVILAVDLFGFPADYDALNRIAETHGLHLLSDAAQSFGAALNGKRAGGLAPVTGASFYPAKPLGCYGDGGAMFTDDDGLAETLRSIRVHGEGTQRYEIARIGVNGRLDSIQAAILSQKLSIFEEELAAREKVAKAYDEGLADVVQVPVRTPNATSAWAQYTIKTPRRGELQAKLNEAGIPVAIFYPKPMHFQPPYAPYGGGPGSLPVSEAIREEVMSLPMHPYLSADDSARIIGEIRKALG